MPIIPISRVQLKYSQEEAKIWKQLVTSSDSTTVDLARVVEMVEEFASAEVETEEKDKIVLEEEAELSITERSAKLEEQSSIMAASLARRANSPKALTYAESRLLLEAMGIPCIQSYLPYEGEALASSLVLHGLADFVGSEDTVNFYTLQFVRVLIATFRPVPGRADVQRPFITEFNEPKPTSANYTTLCRNKLGLIAVRVYGRSDLDGYRLR
jgi:hypothetical protein